MILSQVSLLIYCFVLLDSPVVAFWRFPIRGTSSGATGEYLKILNFDY
jgi:hypothetical protein